MLVRVFGQGALERASCGGDILRAMRQGVCEIEEGVRDGEDACVIRLGAPQLGDEEAARGAVEVAKASRGEWREGVVMLCDGEVEGDGEEPCLSRVGFEEFDGEGGGEQ